MRKALAALAKLLPFRFLAAVLRAPLNFFKELRAYFTEEPDEHTLGDTIEAVAEKPLEALKPHLESLRSHLLRSVAALFITTILSFTFAYQILALLARPLPGGVQSLIAIDVTEPIGTLMRVSLLSGFALALPYIVLEVWWFIAPGLKPKERLYSFLSIPIVVAFFLGGMSFAYFIMLPTAVPFLINILGITTQVRPSSYVSFATGLLFWVGVAFEFPLVIFLLARLHIVQAKTLANQWRLAVVIIAVVSAAITPTVDPVNMSLVMGPLVVLYFLSVGLAYLAQRGDKPQPAPEQA